MAPEEAQAAAQAAGTAGPRFHRCSARESQQQQSWQRWYYYPRMNRNEVLLFKTYDSALDGRTRFTPHSSCKDPRVPDDAPPRESLETRCLAFF